MAKDPAFLFYSQDFLIGTSLLTNEETGKYIKILCWMHQHGPMKKEIIENLVGNLSVNLSVKFSLTEDGSLINNRLFDEIEKRKNFVQSRVNNGKLGGRKPIGKPTGKPLGKAKKNLPENENENVIEDKKVINKGKNEISENEILSTIEFMKITVQIDFTKDKVHEMWKAFLIQSENEFYLTHTKQVQHFRNWLKKQDHDTKRVNSNNSNAATKLGTSDARIERARNW